MRQNTAEWWAGFNAFGAPNKGAPLIWSEVQQADYWRGYHAAADDFDAHSDWSVGDNAHIPDDYGPDHSEWGRW